jgi:hypothetical protein
VRRGIWLALLLLAGAALAHPLAPSLLELRERDRPGGVAARWKTPSRRVPGSDLVPVLPPGCRIVKERRPAATPLEIVTEWDLACDGDTLVGRRIAVRGIAGSRADVLVRVELRDGRRVLRVLRADDEAFVVPPRAGAGTILGGYGRLGMSHILTGFDHLCFVLGLVLLVGGGRRLLWTVTAFTLGHSVTLSLAVLGVVRFPVRPIEVLIALSIYLVAVELVRESRGVLSRQPWLMAFGFGLLHGFGFAGALAEVGLPTGDIPLALFAFNAGIEVGQVAFVVAMLAVGGLLRPFVRRATRIRLVPAYAIGSLAAFWVLDRLLHVVT